MELNKKERLQFSYLLKILEQLYPDEKNYYATHRKAIEEGYELHYSWLTEHLYDGLSKEQCQEVLDILDMYRGIIFSFKALKGNTKLNEEMIKFKGFDGNHETLQMTYAQYFTEDLGRYDEIIESNGGYFNSHFPMLKKYRAMLSNWKLMPVEERYRMTENAISQLLDISY